jgi:hypothetical protein
MRTFSILTLFHPRSVIDGFSADLLCTSMRGRLDSALE